MKVSWIYANGYQRDPSISVDQVKSIGSSWGGWQTWRGNNTDNVICNDLAKSRELLDRAFQAVCNFYVPRNSYQTLGRPVGLKFYESEFNFEIDDIEDIIACHLGSTGADICLLCGYDFNIGTVEDRFEQHKLSNRHGALRSVIANSKCQWVAVDYDKKVNEAYKELPNFTCDTIENVLNLLL